MRELDTQWNGKPVKQAIRFQLEEEDRKLRFQLSFPAGARMHPDAVEDTFTPELWMWDVGEFFLAGPEKRYLEFNLAANGAWWVQGFNDVRVPDPEFDSEELSVEVNGCDLSVSLRALQDYLGGTEHWRVNITAILQSPECEFLSLAKLPGAVADFHQPASFLKYSDIVVD